MSKIATRSAAFLAAGFALSLLAPIDAARAQYYKSEKPKVTADVSLRCQGYVNKIYPASTGAVDRQRESTFRECIRRGGK